MSITDSDIHDFLSGIGDPTKDKQILFEIDSNPEGEVASVINERLAVIARALQPDPRIVSPVSEPHQFPVVDSLRDPARSERFNRVTDELKRLALRWTHSSVNNLQLYERLRNQDPHYNTIKGEEDALLKSYERWRLPVLAVIDEVFSASPQFREVARLLSLAADADELAKVLDSSYSRVEDMPFRCLASFAGSANDGFFYIAAVILAENNKEWEALYCVAHCLISPGSVNEDSIAKVMLDQLMRLKEWRVATAIGGIWPDFGRLFLSELDGLRLRQFVTPMPSMPYYEECLAFASLLSSPKLAKLVSNLLKSGQRRLADIDDESSPRKSE